METNEMKQSYGNIRGRLVSAVAMLLVAVIMVVSSTYAWFTLSTAPEVTGISTAVGANGALEMLLLTKDDNNEWVYESGEVADNKNRNTYWGNLVDLSGASYGANLVTLYPSQLELLDNGKLNHENNTLSTPKYGSDGRVESVEANTSFGTYENGAFYANGDYGFRAIGVSSGMTERQLAYRTALTNINVSKSLAQTSATASLENNGSTLADIAVTKAMIEGSEYTQEQVDSISNMIGELKVALDHIEDAYIHSILAYAASSLSGDEDSAYTTISGVIESASRVSGNCSDLEAIVNALTTGVNLPTQLTDGINAYKATLAKVNSAKVPESANGTGGGYTWEQLEEPLSKLVTISSLQINGSATIDKDKIAADVFAGKGIKVTMPTGAGVYADIADHCGDYSAGITISGAKLGISAEAPATMNTATTKTANGGRVYIETIYGAVSNNAPNDGSAAKPLSEFYGYAIDLAFRTNAAQSSLLLQDDGIDRIYSENSNEETLGKGSYMTFSSADPNFSTAQMKALMGNIKIVFFDPADGTVYAYAKLDTSETGTTTTAEGIKAKMYVYETVTAYQYTETAGDAATSETKIVYKKTETTTEGGTTETYYDNSQFTGEAVDVTGKELTAVSVDVRTTNRKIVDLDQNVAKNVSALVYLDGTTIENSHVAATAAKSMVGKVNFQFASSAELVPMEYGDLHTVANVPVYNQDLKITSTSGASLTLSGNGATTWEFDGTAPAGMSISGTTLSASAAVANGTYTVIGKDADGKTVAKINVIVTNTASAS